MPSAPDSKPLLFIGGPRDGEWVKVDPMQEHVRVYVAQPFQLLTTMAAEATAPLMETPNAVSTHTYRLERMRCGPGEELRVMVYSHLSIFQAMNRLLQCYVRPE